MPLYKQAIITNLKASPKEISDTLKECAKMILDNGGVIRQIENRGVQLLGYAIKDRRWGGLDYHREGKLVVMQFNSSAEIKSRLDMKIKTSFSFIRHATFKIMDPINNLYNTRYTFDEIQKIIQNKKNINKVEKDRLTSLDAKKRRYRPLWRTDCTHPPLKPYHPSDDLSFSSRNTSRVGPITY